MAGKLNKYRSKKTVGYDSKKEAMRAIVLHDEFKRGLVSDLREGVYFELAPSVVISGRKKPALRYKADFVYVRDGITIVEDVKGVLTPVYRIKRHLMKSVHNIDIFET